MLSATKATKAKQRWTAKSVATPEIIDEYVSGARFGENDEYIQAARDAASEYLKRQVRALKDGTGEDSTVADIDGQHIIYVDGFEAGVKWVLRRMGGKVSPLIGPPAVKTSGKQTGDDDRAYISEVRA